VTATQHSGGKTASVKSNEPHLGFRFVTSQQNRNKIISIIEIEVKRKHLFDQHYAFGFHSSDWLDWIHHFIIQNMKPFLCIITTLAETGLLYLCFLRFFLNLCFYHIFYCTIDVGEMSISMVSIAWNTDSTPYIKVHILASY